MIFRLSINRVSHVRYYSRVIKYNKNKNTFNNKLNNIKNTSKKKTNTNSNTMYNHNYVNKSDIKYENKNTRKYKSYESYDSYKNMYSGLPIYNALDFDFDFDFGCFDFGCFHDV